MLLHALMSFYIPVQVLDASLGAINLQPGSADECWNLSPAGQYIS